MNRYHLKLLALFTLAISIWAVAMHLRQRQSVLRGQAIPPPLRTKDGRTILRWKQEPTSQPGPATAVPAQGQQPPPSPAASTPPPPPADAIPNEFVLSFFNDYDRRQFMELAEARHIPILGTSSLGHAVRIEVRDPKELEDLLSAGPAPLESGPNYAIRSPRLVVGKNPLPKATGYVGFENLSLPWLGIHEGNAAWGKGITVAVLDTGILPHPALANTAIRTISLPGMEQDNPGTAEFSPHGTAVASLIAGHGDEVRGVAPGATILNIPVLSAAGSGDAFTLANGIVEAVDQGADIINLCLGSQGDSFLLQQAITYARQHGVAIVAAVGNDAVEGVLYPARYDGVVAVSAVDAVGQHLFFANRGEEVDIAAPGYAVHAAWERKKVIPFSGTSAAAPFVSGALAALLSGNPDLGTRDAVDLLEKYVNDTGLPGRDIESGAGIMNIQRIQERDTAGIYDVAVGDIAILPDESAQDLSVVISAQNRGTETIDQLNLIIEADGQETSLAFYNVAATETVSETFMVPGTRLEDDPQLPVRLAATLPNHTDRNPRNNVRKAVIMLSKDGAQ